MKKSKAFTLIELIAVLVILAILALIVTPLVLNIIKKARTAADKRSIDAYGRSIELAIADYLLDKGEFPTSIEQLQVEYTGDEVVCNTTTLNEDGGVYLAECTVGGRTVSGYTYGKEQTVTYKAYSVGDEVTYNNVDYYVIKNSGVNESSVTLLKAEPITSSEISPYLTSTEVANKVNTSGTYATMAYYSVEDCVSAGDQSGCSSDYSVSDVKQLVDVWKINYASGATETRLATLNDLPSLGFELQPKNDTDSTLVYKKTQTTPSWAYSSSYSCWTMSQEEDSNSNVWYVGYDGNLDRDGVTSPFRAVRPVIVLSKSVLN